MAKAKNNLKELKAIGEELFEILMPEDPDTGEEMELDDFLKGGNKKITEKGLKKTLIEACEALEEEDGEEASKELMDFMAENGIDIPWDSDEEPDEEDEDEDEPDDDDEPDDEEEEDDDDDEDDSEDDDDEDDESDDEEEEETDDDDDEDEEEAPDFNKMKIAELKAYCKENGIKGIAGKKKPELIELIESSLGENEPDEEKDDEDDETESKYEDVSTKELKKMLKKAGHSPKAIKKMDRDEMIEHLEAADDEDDELDEEEDKELTLEEILNETTKLADLQALVAEHDEFKKLRKKAKKIKGLHGPRELKPLMYKALGVEPPKQKRKAKGESKKKKGPSYNRIDSVKDAIKKLGKKGFTQEEIRELSDKLYCEKTGNDLFADESKMHPATHIVNYMVQGLVAFEVLEKDGKKYKLA